MPSRPSIESSASVDGPASTAATDRRLTRRDGWCLLLYITFAIATGFADLRMRAHTDHVVKSYIPGVVAGTEDAPGKYRVFAPLMIDGLARLTGASLESAWYVTRLAWIVAAYCVFHVYLRTWFPSQTALTGVSMVAASLPLTFTNSWPHPDSMPELALFTLGAMAIARGADLLFAVALAMAALNRETSVFLVLLYVVSEPLSRRRLVGGMVFGAEWFAIYAGLRLLRGLQHYDYWQAARNLAELGLLPSNYDPYYRAYAYFVVILFGPMLYVAVKRSEAPQFVRRALLVVPCFIAIAFIFSSIIETRIFTPLYALVLPATLFVFVSRPPANELTDR
jgi:hypothetical protein